MSVPVRINVYGGPGIGKSVFAAKLYVALSERGCKVEHVNEWIKTWAWLKYKIQSFDQLYVLAKQIRKEDIVLRNGTSLVTDSPILMQLAYIRRDCPYLLNTASEAHAAFSHHHPGSLNIFLERTVQFSTDGRYENLEQAKEMDKRIENEFRNIYGPNQMSWVDPLDEGDVARIIDYLVGKTP